MLSKISWRKSLLSIASAYLLVGCSRKLKETIPEPQPDLPPYELVWSDEFNVDGPPDTSNWSYEIGFIRNEELQYYQPQNAFCEDGSLVIEARREKQRNARHDPNNKEDWKKSRAQAEYTSSCLITKDKHAWQYGRFEVRAKVDTSLGLWPAFWTLGVEGEWPGTGEIDILEYYRGRFMANTAWANRERWQASWNMQRNDLERFPDSIWINQWHVWRMDWTPDFIEIYMDDFLLNRTPLRRTVNRYGPRFNPMRQPHYILLNLAIGGQSGGDPSQTTFPRRFEVDYVRVYQRPYYRRSPRGT